MFGRIMLIGLMAVVFAAGAALLWKELETQARDDQPAPPRVTVATARVQQETWQRYVHAVGSLTAVHGIDVTTEVEGQVVRRSSTLSTGSSRILPDGINRCCTACWSTAP